MSPNLPSHEAGIFECVYFGDKDSSNDLKIYLNFNLDGITNEDVANASLADISALFERNIKYFKSTRSIKMESLPSRKVI